VDTIWSGRRREPGPVDASDIGGRLVPAGSVLARNTFEGRQDEYDAYDELPLVRAVRRFGQGFIGLPDDDGTPPAPPPPQIPDTRDSNPANHNSAIEGARPRYVHQVRLGPAHAGVPLTNQPDDLNDPNRYLYRMDEANDSFSRYTCCKTGTS
jgi:hypothetical protein